MADQNDQPQGNPPQGNPPQGNPPQGNPPQGNPPQGNPQQGNPQQGNPQQGNPPPASQTAHLSAKFFAVIWVPVVVLIWNLAAFGGSNDGTLNLPAPLPSQQNVVARAQVGLPSKGGSVINCLSDIAVNITLMVRNADGWLIDMAERHPKEMLKDPDFQLPTFLAWKKNKVNIPGQPANTKEDEEKFEKWVSDKVKANPGLLTADKMGDDSLLKQVLAIDANPPAKVEAAVVTKWNGALLEYVDKTPGSLEGSGFTSLDALKNFLSQRGKMAVLVTADEKARARAWLAGVYDMLRLNVAGRHLASIAPTPGMKHALSDVEMPQQTKDDTWERIAFANVKPDKNDLEVWQHLVQTHGLECAAPLSLSIQLGDTKSVVETMPTLVNQGVSGEKEDFGLPMRSRLMRALAWSAMFGVLWFIVLVCVQTSVLRESLQVGNTLVTRYEESPWSASRLVFAWWLAICTSCFLFLWAMKGEMKVLSATAATLLGISGTTLAASSFLGASRGMKPQKATQGFLADIISESGEPEISRLQMLVWNGVLGVVFVWQTLENWVMPDFDPNLNALVGISSTAYVGYKWSNQKQDGQANANPNPNANVNGNVRG